MMLMVGAEITETFAIGRSVFGLSILFKSKPLPLVLSHNYPERPPVHEPKASVLGQLYSNAFSPNHVPGWSVHNDIPLYALLRREGVDEIPQLVVATRLEEFVVTCGAVN